MVCPGAAHRRPSDLCHGRVSPGIILWELCTGKRANPRRDYRQVECPGEAPEEIRDVIERCKAFKPQVSPPTYSNITAPWEIAAKCGGGGGGNGAG